MVCKMERTKHLGIAIRISRKACSTISGAIVSKMRTKMHPFVLVIKRLLVALIRAVSVKSETRIVIG